MNIDHNLALRLVGRLDALAIPYGREDSFKLGRQRLLADRVLIGVDSTRLATDKLLAIAIELGMPHACLKVLLPHAAVANAVFFGFEELADSCVCKVYLEFWDQVRREVRRTGARTPLLLHLGVKWNSAQPGRHEIARYDCHPMIDTRTILRRMALCYRDELCMVHEAARDVVLAAASRNPAASMLYLEVGEQGNPRRSFDINLYKTGMSVADAAPQLYRAAEHLQVTAELMEAQLQRLGTCPLGHLSSGMDRHGQAFLSVYAETLPLI
jgi:hypothetical protein